METNQESVGLRNRGLKSSMIGSEKLSEHLEESVHMEQRKQDMLAKSWEQRMRHWNDSQGAIMADLRNCRDQENDDEEIVAKVKGETDNFISRDLANARRTCADAKILADTRRENKAEILQDLQNAQSVHAQTMEKCRASKKKYLDKKQEYDDMQYRWRIGHVDAHSKRVERRLELDQDKVV